MARITTIALDIEGTLISNAVSQFPRPGLFAFLEFCRESFDHVYIYTAVRDETCVRIVRTLIDDGFAPEWLAEISFVQWDRSVKDLGNVPGCSVSESLLLDDNRDYVVDSQIDQWIEIDEFQSPYRDTDTELQRVQSVVRERLSSWNHLRRFSVRQHGFYARPAAHLPTLATRAGLGTISSVQASLASFRAVS